jgi:hypothetical protein
MFALPFEEIAPIVGRTPGATRKLASRARLRVRGAAPRPDGDLAAQRAVVDAFLAAAREGDFEALVSLLDPDVIFRIDRGEIAAAARRPAVVRGATEVARLALEGGARFAPFCRPAIVNGAAGLVVAPGPRPVGVVAFTIVDGRIAQIDVVADRKKVAAAVGTAGD